MKVNWSADNRLFDLFWAEILLSGASSIYGADAVAGVVNIITPKDFEGVQFDATFASPGSASGEETIASLQFGGASDQIGRAHV